MASFASTELDSTSTSPRFLRNPKKLEPEPRRRSQSRNRTFKPETAADTASDNAIVVFPSFGTVDVTWITFGGLSTFAICIPLRSVRTDSLNRDKGETAGRYGNPTRFP